MFNCMRIGESYYQSSVHIDVSGTRFPSDPAVTVALLFGDICSTPKAARASAVSAAFEYLEEKHFIQVLDYSSALVAEFNRKPVFGNVDSCHHTVKKVLDEWALVLDEIKEFHSQLAADGGSERAHNVDGTAVEVYSETKHFLESIINKYTEKHKAFHAVFKGYESRRDIYLKERDDKATAYLLKVM